MRKIYKIYKRTLIPIIGLVVLLGAGVLGLATVKRVQAQTTSPTIVQRITQRFGLNEGDVKGVFDEQRQEQFQEKQKFEEQRLTQAVSDGAITEAQKQALLDKWTEIQGQEQKIRDDYQKWLEDQGIDVTKLAPYAGFGHHGGFGGGGMMGMMGR